MTFYIPFLKPLFFTQTEKSFSAGLTRRVTRLPIEFHTLRRFLSVLRGDDESVVMSFHNIVYVVGTLI